MTENPRPGASLWRAGGVSLLLLLLVVFIVQNVTPLPVRFLFFDFSMPGAVLVLVPFLLGIVVSLATAAHKARARR